jgi:hypothetical protein
MLHLFMAAAGGAAGGGTDITGLAQSALKALEKIGSLALVVFVGYKALGHLAQDKYGQAIGLLLIALIPALFLIDPTGASALLKNTIATLTGGGG